MCHIIDAKSKFDTKREIAEGQREDEEFEKLFAAHPEPLYRRITAVFAEIDDVTGYECGCCESLMDRSPDDVISCARCGTDILLGD